MVRELENTGAHHEVSPKAHKLENLGGYHEKNRGAHVIVDFLMEHATSELTLLGQENLEQFRELKRKGAKRGLIGNHRSNADAGVLEYTLQKYGYQDIADDLVFGLGMKLKFKRGSTFLTHGYSHIDISPVDLKDLTAYAAESTKINRQALRASRQIMEEGKAFVIFGEGTRTRTGEMAPFIPIVAHYFNEPDTHVLPFAVYGTETVWPVGKRFLKFHPRGSATVAFGEPVEARKLMVGEGKDRYTNFVTSMRSMVESLLPEQYLLPYNSPSK